MSIGAGVPVAQCLFDASTICEIPLDMRPAKLMLLTYTFDHLPDPLSFLSAVQSAMDSQNGLLILEVHDLEKIIDRTEICLFQHEHSIYLTALSAKRLLERANLKLLTLDVLPEKERRGNSLLIVAAPQSSGHIPDSSVDLSNLTPSPFDEWSTYAAFSQKVENGLSKFRNYIRSGKKSGRRFAGYGAGGRGVMNLAMAGLTRSDIAYLCDRNPSFHGLFTPCSHIPVVAPEHLLSNYVDETIVFSFGYMDEIRCDLSQYIERGGKLISILDLLQ